MAARIGRFDKAALAETKALVDQVTLPANEVFQLGLAAYFRSVTRPQTRERTAALVQRGLQKPTDLERRLGYYLGQPQAG
jgi:hypothetical protein